LQIAEQMKGSTVQHCLYFVMSAHHNEKRFKRCDISGFRHEVDYVCALMRHCAEYSGSSLPTFRETYR